MSTFMKIPAGHLLRRSGYLGVLAALALGLTATPSAASVTYTYDSLGRLASAAYDNGTTLVYSYDENGNRLVQVTISG